MVESQKVPGVNLGPTTEPQVVRMIVKTPWQVEEFLVHKDMFVREFKEHVARHFSSSPNHVELVYGGRILKDHKTLSQHAIHLDDNATVYVVIRSQRAAPTQQVSAAPTSATLDQKPVRSSTFARNRLRELTASLGLNTANFDEFQSQLMSNPDMMLQLLENPFIQSKLSSPGLMKELVTNNPQVQQVMQRAPEISHFFTSPEGMRLVVALAKNPAAVREIIRSPPQALGSPRSVPSGDNNNLLQDTLMEVQGLVERHFPKRQGPSPRGQCSPHDREEQPGHIRECLSSPKTWPPKTGVPKVASSGSDHSKGESNGAIRGESGQLASATVKSLLHQIIKHLMQNITGSPCRNPAGQPLSHPPKVLAQMIQRRASGSKNSQEQGSLHIPALLQQIQSMDVLLANWNPKEIQGLLEIQQRLQALATDEPASERRGRSERPARKAHSITSLCDVAQPSTSRIGLQDLSAQQILQTLVGSDLFSSSKTTSRLRGSSAQPTAKQKRMYKL
ncbi:ubiquilin-1-like [Sceloporus undulatus]|uniref:ubiquilin-1-like n=1 Tax=Sceloporus undulatus TaxID=8520 RepID=UPI001C4BE257|nr:ubiquilin-1-like [Sceloporus undulatus]